MNLESYEPLPPLVDVTLEKLTQHDIDSLLRSLKGTSMGREFIGISSHDTGTIAPNDLMNQFSVTQECSESDTNGTSDLSLEHTRRQEGDCASYLDIAGSMASTGFSSGDVNQYTFNEEREIFSTENKCSDTSIAFDLENVFGNMHITNKPTDIDTSTSAPGGLFKASPATASKPETSSKPSSIQKSKTMLKNSQSQKDSTVISMKRLRYFDVLLMRGSFANKHTGNIYYRKEVMKSKVLYDVSDKKTKTSLTWQVVIKVKEKGGRFLVFKDRSKGELMEVSESVARKKASQAFRDTKRKNETKQSPLLCYSL